MNSYTVSLCFTLLRLPGSQLLTFVILTKSSQCLLTLLICSAAAFSNGIFTNCLHACAHGLLEIHVIIATKWGVPNGNHTNDDVAEVNGLAAPMLPGSPPRERAWI